MGKVIFEFDGNEEKSEINIVNNRGLLIAALSGIQSLIRSHNKYNELTRQELIDDISDVISETLGKFE